MAFFIKFGTSVGQSFGMGRVYGMKLGGQTLTPRNLRFMIPSPGDVATGQASGRPPADPFTVTKEIDYTSAQLMSPACTGKGIPEVHIHIFRANSQGITQPYGRLTLTNARPVRYTRKPIPIHTPGHGHGGGHEMEEVEFTYQAIEWTWTPAAVSSCDDWEAAA